MLGYELRGAKKHRTIPCCEITAGLQVEDTGTRPTVDANNTKRARQQTQSGLLRGTSSALNYISLNMPYAYLCMQLLAVFVGEKVAECRSSTPSLRINPCIFRT